MGCILYFLYVNKKWLLLFILMTAAFFAKGSDLPLGEIYTFVITQVPLGYMIRNPDVKFGIFILASVIVAFRFFDSKQIKIALCILSCFLINNIYGMYLHGALSPSQGDLKTTYYVYDDEYQALAKFVNNQSNFVVLSNEKPCQGQFYDGKFHTCNDILLSNINKQIVGAQFGSMGKRLELYQAFPKLIVINKQLQNPQVIDENLLLPSAYENVYDSSHYQILRQKIAQQNTQNTRLPFSCSPFRSGYLLSVSEVYFKFTYPNTPYEKYHDFVLVQDCPASVDHDWRRSVIVGSVTAIFSLALLCLLIL